MSQGFAASAATGNGPKDVGAEKNTPAETANKTVPEIGESGISALNAPATLSILAVDDDPLVLMNVTALLEDLGHSVVEAHSGPKALDLLRSGQSFHMLITDQSMPGMTGIELATAARDVAPDIKIVVATGYADLPGAKVRFVKLQKPFLDDDLTQAIEKAMSDRD